MNDTRVDNEPVRRFVRKSLGCGCPDEVFEHIRIRERSDLFSLRNTVFEIGGRLFVVVIDAPEWRAVEPHLGGIVQTGRTYRDRHGYNRFRLVIATEDAGAQRELGRLFEALPDIDDKTHLHVISPQQIPGHGRSATTA